MATRRRLFLLVAALFCATGVLPAAEKGAAVPAKPDISTQLSPDLQKLIAQFNSRRDTLLADHQALLDQLKNATAGERKQILDKMQAQQKELIEAQRALGKQIRDEMRKLRGALPGGTRR